MRINVEEKATYYKILITVEGSERACPGLGQGMMVLASQANAIREANNSNLWMPICLVG